MWLGRSDTRTHALFWYLMLTRYGNSSRRRSSTRGHRLEACSARYGGDLLQFALVDGRASSTDGYGTRTKPSSRWSFHL
ncbi:hypothetical protein LB505_002565 [Fusarium chuoi]|nr:hypothetical protein LB505_002565 [Fusarium chuoi]